MSASMWMRVPDPFGQILLVRRGRPRPDGEVLPVLLARSRIERLDATTLRRIAIEQGLPGGEDELRRALDEMLRRGELVALRQARRRAVVQLAAPAVLGPIDGVEAPETFDIGLMLLDPWGWPLPVPCYVTRPQEPDEQARVVLGDAEVRVDAHRYGTCGLDFMVDELPRLEEPREQNPKAHPPTDIITWRQWQCQLQKRTRGPGYVFQLERLKATVMVRGLASPIWRSARRRAARM